MIVLGCWLGWLRCDVGVGASIGSGFGRNGGLYRAEEPSGGSASSGAGNL
jgi:hypothetical protein